LTTNQRRGWTAYYSHRLWILCALFAVLTALALMQYRWINQITEAQRQRTEANLSTSISNIESDFDVEITRAFLTFQVPFENINYAQRYEEWLRHAPYPGLLKGVYIVKPGDTLATPVVPGEPTVRSVEWHRDLRQLQPQFGGITATVSGQVQFQEFSTSGGPVALVSSGPEATVDGNPAFALPLIFPVPRVARPITNVQRTRKERGFQDTEALQDTEIVRSGRRIGPPQWILLVFDANYIRSTFLPTLVERYFRGSSGSDFDVVVVDRIDGPRPMVVFPVELTALSSGFGHPDKKVPLFQLRPDCFSAFPRPAAIPAAIGPPIDFDSVDRLSQILAQKPTECGQALPSMAKDADGSWELLARYRAGSLDEAMAIFRRRNFLLSGTALLVVALGISMAVLLAERARALAEMQAEFILGVSHELRTPLTVIRVAADNLKRGMVENAEQAHSYGAIIHGQAKELSNMIEETLALARMRSEMTRYRNSVAPEQFLNEVVADNCSALQDAGMKLEFDIAPGLPLVEVDVHLIKRSVGNLIQNAIKYAVASERLTVRARKVTRHDKEMVEISVEDHGPGISTEDLPHIFEPFYRGKAANTSRTPGIGLGLTLVKRAVEAHDGAVEVESEKATRFSIFLPSQYVRRDGHEGV
jgi:two-component system sensor histidine kinase SenX3